jgi:hypothetical protein
MDRWLQERGVTLMGADLDESPLVYRFRASEEQCAADRALCGLSGVVLHALHPLCVKSAECLFPDSCGTGSAWSLWERAPRAGLGV